MNQLLLILAGLYVLYQKKPSALDIAGSQDQSFATVPASFTVESSEPLNPPKPQLTSNPLGEVLGIVQQVKGPVSQIVKAVTGATTAGESVAGGLSTLSGAAPLAPSGAVGGSVGTVSAAAGGEAAGVAGSSTVVTTGEVAGAVGGGVVAAVGLGLLGAAVVGGNLLIGAENRPGSDMKYGEENVLNPAEYNKGLFASGILKTGGGSVSTGGGKFALGTSVSDAGIVSQIYQANQ